jgi:hypothetical protein
MSSYSMLIALSSKEFVNLYIRHVPRNANEGGSILSVGSFITISGMLFLCCNLVLALYIKEEVSCANEWVGILPCVCRILINMS